MHESLAYSCDWFGNDIITASFYDKKIKKWKINFPQ